MATSHDFEGTITLSAPAGGATAGTMLYYSTTGKMVVLPMTTATSGNDFAAKVIGVVKGVTKSTAGAWVAGQRVTSNTSVTFAVSTAADYSHGFAIADATAGATTGDIYLTGPVSAP